MNLTNYILHRSDSCSMRGGLAIYVFYDLVSELVLPTIEPLHFECVFVKVIFHVNKCLTIGSIYRQPSSSAESSNNH